MKIEPPALPRDPWAYQLKSSYRWKWMFDRSFFCRVCGNDPPFNIWSAGMNSLIKSHLEVDFYGLLSIAVSILCCLIFELNGVILLIFDCLPLYIPLSWSFILHISYCLLRIFLFYALHVDALITLYVLLFSSSGMNLNSITIYKSEITLLRFYAAPFVLQLTAIPVHHIQYEADDWKLGCKV